MQHAFVGSGPGVQAPDGCSVELYRSLPYMGELAEVESELRTHRDVLELGCGTGRLCGRMLEMGLDVTGVDASAEMLAHMPRGVWRVQSPIERLNLGRTWSAVVLPSHMINHPDAHTRRAFVQAACDHIAPGGSFFVSCYPQRWLELVQEGSLGDADELRMSIENLCRREQFVSMRFRYGTTNGEWTHDVTAASLSKQQIEDLLGTGGFSRFRWFERSYVWVVATAADT